MSFCKHIINDYVKKLQCIIFHAIRSLWQSFLGQNNREKLHFRK